MKNKKQNLKISFLIATMSLASLSMPLFANQTELESQEIPSIQSSPYSTDVSDTSSQSFDTAESVTNSSGSQVLAGEVVSISKGAYAPGNIDRGFTSATSRVGDRGYLTLNQNLEGIPSGSKVEFIVSRVSRAKRRFDKPGEMQLKAVKIVYPDGQVVPLTGEVYIVRDSGSTVLVGEANKKRVAKAAGKTAAGAATGALGGLIGSSIGGRTSGKATAIGAGIGAGLGLLGAGLSKGDEVTVNSGDKLLLKFNESMRLNAQ